MLISVSAQTGAEPSNQIETASMPQLAAEGRSDRARCGPDCRRVSASITTIRSLDQETAGKRQSVVHGLQRELAELRAQIATLKVRPQMNYRGAGKPGEEYAAGSVCTWDDPAWGALVSTNLEPGSGGSSETGWQLAVKRGADGQFFGAPTISARRRRVARKGMPLR
jgi:hypothetical protein